MKRTPKYIISVLLPFLLFVWLINDGIASEVQNEKLDSLINRGIVKVGQDPDKAIQELLVTFGSFVLQNDTTGWESLLQTIPSTIEPKNWYVLTALLDEFEIDSLSNLDSTTSIISSTCDRWVIWHCARFKLELAAGKFSQAIDRYFRLLDSGVSSFDYQYHLWYFINIQIDYLDRERRFEDLLRLLETTKFIFPSGPARGMNSWVAMLRFRFGKLEWNKKVKGVFGETMQLAMASHSCEFITEEGDTLELWITKSTVWTFQGKYWSYFDFGLPVVFDLDEYPTLKDLDKRREKPPEVADLQGLCAVVYINDSDIALLVEYLK